jgi:hypothetical protein
MLPIDLPGNPQGQWALGGKDGYIIYANAGHTNVDLVGKKFRVHRFPQEGGATVYWLEK